MSDPEKKVPPYAVRVMLVDDSAVVRGMLRQLIDKEDDLTIVGTAVNGERGIAEYTKLKPDVVLMDIEMPEMNGIEALQAILKIEPNAKVIMCSSLTQTGAIMTIDKTSEVKDHPDYFADFAQGLFVYGQCVINRQALGVAWVCFDAKELGK